MTSTSLLFFFYILLTGIIYRSSTGIVLIFFLSLNRDCYLDFVMLDEQVIFVGHFTVCQCSLPYGASMYQLFLICFGKAMEIQMVKGANTCFIIFAFFCWYSFYATICMSSKAHWTPFCTCHIPTLCTLSFCKFCWVTPNDNNLSLMFAISLL